MGSVDSEGVVHSILRVLNQEYGADADWMFQTQAYPNPYAWSSMWPYASVKPSRILDLARHGDHSGISSAIRHVPTREEALKVRARGDALSTAEDYLLDKSFQAYLAKHGVSSIPERFMLGHGGAVNPPNLGPGARRERYLGMQFSKAKQDYFWSGVENLTPTYTPLEEPSTAKKALIILGMRSAAFAPFMPVGESGAVIPSVMGATRSAAGTGAAA